LAAFCRVCGSDTKRRSTQRHRIVAVNEFESDHEERRQAQTAMLKPNGTRARRLGPSGTDRGMPSVSTASEVRPSGRVSEAEAAETVAGRDHVLAGLIARAGPMRLWHLRS
jgi:hypothetical protein